MKLTQDQIVQVNEGDSRTYVLEIDGKRFEFISVTSVLNYLLNKPAIIPWAFNVGCEETLELVQERLREAIAGGTLTQTVDDLVHVSPEVVKKYLREQERTHDSRKLTGADRGVVVHRYLEARIKGEDAPPECEAFSDYTAQIEKFLIAYKPEFHETELKVVNFAHEFAGTLDAVCTITVHPPRKRHASMKGKRIVLDLKTNKEGQVYPMIHMPQVDAYQMAYWEMGGEVGGGAVLAVGASKYQFCPNYYPEGTFVKILDAYKAIVDGNNANPNKRKEHKY